MTGKAKARLYAAITLLFFGALATIAGPLLGVPGLSRWIFRGGIWLLGAVAGLIVYLMFSKGEKEAPSETAEIDEVFSNARTRLDTSGIDGGKIGKRPVVLFLGPSGSTKTTLIEQSGLHAELLAGDVYRREAVVPTDSANVWFGDGTLLVEAGGGLVEETGKWSRLVRHLRPDRLAATFGRARLAPRLAVVCFPCTEFLESGSSESVPAAARELRDRLGELASRLGIRLPVYVVFTKIDRLPYFQEYARSLSEQEARQVLGATLSMEPPGGRSTYADRESARLLSGFDSLFHALATRRLEFLHREADEAIRPGLYEFPREFRKVRDLAVEFLVELGRPSQLSVSPFVRGFYFTGVRPVIVQDSPGPAPVVESRDRAAPGATRVFDPSRQQQEAPSASPVSGSRKVPEWVFLRRLFRDVLLGDQLAMAVTGGGRQVNLLRRTLIGSIAALALVVVLGMSISFLQNRRLHRDVRAAYAQTGSLPSVEPDLPSEADLGNLDVLRRQVDKLRQHQIDDPPQSYRWGLYSGADLLPHARQVYFDRAYPLLAGPALGRVTTQLLAIDATDASSDYRSTHDALKVHLVTGGECPSSPEFLAPTLTDYWLDRYQLIDADLRGLTQQHFDFYARELPYGDPYGLSPDPGVRDPARAYLESLEGDDAFYQLLTARASEQSDSIRFSDEAPGSGTVLRNDYVVPGAFTRRGWLAVQTALADEQMLAGEECVTGGGGLSTNEKAELRVRLRQRYVEDYNRHWASFLANASVTGFGSPRQAEQSLALLSGNRSPILHLLSLIAWNTDVDSASVGGAFQPVHSLMPPDTTRFVHEQNRPYIDRLESLRSSVEQVASATGDARAGALDQATDDASQVISTVRQLANNFDTQGDALAVGSDVTGLLTRPASLAQNLLGAIPAGELNGKGRQFCSVFDELTAKFPFSPQSGERATWSEVDDMFKPGGAFDSFYDEWLQDLLTRGGTRKLGDGPRPTDEFVRFFQSSAQISSALYGHAGAPGSIAVLLRLEAAEPIEEVTVRINGRPNTFTPNSSQLREFPWSGSTADEAQIQVRMDGSVTVAYDFAGTWALHNLLAQAEWDERGGGTYLLRWPVPGTDLTILGELSLTGSESARRFLNVRSLSNLRCVSTVAR